jgi:anti-anti-sigma factor
MTTAMRRTDLGCGLVCLTVSGEIEGPMLDAFETAVTDILADPETRALVVDLKAVDLLEPAGMARLAVGYRLARSRDIPFQVINPRGLVRQVLDLAGVLTSGAESQQTLSWTAGFSTPDRVPGGSWRSRH